MIIEILRPRSYDNLFPKANNILNNIKIIDQVEFFADDSEHLLPIFFLVLYRKGIRSFLLIAVWETINNQQTKKNRKTDEALF
jgi:hypothetical protein